MDREESAPRATFRRFGDDVLQLWAPGSVTVDVEVFEVSVDSCFVEGPAEQRRTPPSAAVSSRQIAVDSSIAVSLSSCRPTAESRDASWSRAVASDTGSVQAALRHRSTSERAAAATGPRQPRLLPPLAGGQPLCRKHRRC